MLPTSKTSWFRPKSKHKIHCFITTLFWKQLNNQINDSKTPRTNPRNLYLLNGKDPMNPWLIPCVCGGQCCYLRCGHVHQQLPQKQLLVPILLREFSLLCPSLTFFIFYFFIFLGFFVCFWAKRLRFESRLQCLCSLSNYADLSG